MVLTAKSWNQITKQLLLMCYLFHMALKKKLSKYNSDRENQVILLMIADNKKWHYHAVKKLSAWFRGIASANNECRKKIRHIKL